MSGKTLHFSPQILMIKTLRKCDPAVASPRYRGFATGKLTLPNGLLDQHGNAKRKFCSIQT